MLTKFNVPTQPYLCTTTNMAVTGPIKNDTQSSTLPNKSTEYDSDSVDSDTDEPEYIIPSLTELEATLLDDSQPISKRTRTIFLLKQIDTNDAIDILIKGLISPSVLLAHEIAYVMGQMNNSYCIPALLHTLHNRTLDPIVRHEAVEALGNIGNSDTITVLESVINDSTECNEVVDTAKISIDKIKYTINYRANAFKLSMQQSTVPLSKYSSVDPAPPYNDITDIQKLQQILCNRECTLFERYRAMFTLRNIGTEQAVNALVAGFDSEPINTGSAVFRHEIAYVLGQLAHPSAQHALVTVLSRSTEHAMTRHEAAEALGAISGDGHDTEHIDSVLKEYLNDKDTVVKESCAVALDISEYWRSDQFDTAVQ